MKKKKKFSRLTALLLAVMMLLPSHTSLLVLAEEKSDGLCEHHPAHTVECGYVEGVSPCTYVCQECAKNVEDSDDKSKEEEADRKTDEEEKPQEDKPEALAASNIPGVAAEVLEKLAQEGIYPGAHPAAGDPWVVYDAENEGEANVKATVTLPDGANVPDDYYLFIRKVNENEPHYPTENAVTTKVGEHNDFQCYAIHWVKIEGDTFDYNTDSVLKDGTSAEITIEYLKDDARLKGNSAERKLMIFNSTNTGEELDEVSDTVEAVKADNNAYNGFTFQTSKAGPYVFVSKKVFKGYVESLKIDKVIDGDGAFDNTGNLKDGTMEVDVPGNDANNHNQVVRSFDTIKYDLQATFNNRNTTATAENATLRFEMVLQKRLTDAKLDLGAMNWIEDYKVEYLDANDKVIYTYDGATKELLDENGKVTSINALVSGSTHGTDSYKSIDEGRRVEKQRITGAYYLTKTEANSNVIIGSKTFSAGIQVLNAKNGDVFAPTFKIWFEGNEDNYGRESDSDGEVHPAQKVEKNYTEVGKGQEVVVSAGAQFNLQLKKNVDLTYKNWFDFETGNIVEPSTRAELEKLAALEVNKGESDPSKFKADEDGTELPQETKERYKNYRYGRITGYGITLQLYSDTDNGGIRAEKKMKGMALPVDGIEFDLNFTSSAKSGKEEFDKENYTPILWDYNENNNILDARSLWYVDPGRGTIEIPGSRQGHWNRQLYWNNEIRSYYGKGAGPSNYKVTDNGQQVNGCYYGGNWSINNDKTETSDVTGTGADTTYHFTVSDYDFDFDNYFFPSGDVGNSGNVGLYTSYAKCFSSGFVQVLSVFPRYQKKPVVDLELKATVNNLKLKTRGGQILEPDNNDPTGYKHEANDEQAQKDNVKTDKIDLYSVGGMTKGNSFNLPKDGREPLSMTDGYLGSDYWSTSYDCSAFAGDKIYLMGYGMLNANTDYRIKSMNLLQLFDSSALSIDGEPAAIQDDEYGAEGEAKILYAADPARKQGYDTNENGVLEYMNGIREEDLVYYESLEDLKAAGYTCVGVLMEIRGCDFQGGTYQHLRIPVKINGDNTKLIGETIATVNTVRVWTDESHLQKGDGTYLSWKDGVWDENAGKNTLEGYKVPDNKVTDEKYCGQVANGLGNQTNYVKTEYADGAQAAGTHQGGVQSGNSLLILGYKATINLDVQGDKLKYDMDKGETTVTYRLYNIAAQESNKAGTEQKTTELTVKVDFDKGEGAKNRILYMNGSAVMQGYTELDADGQPVGDKQNITIGTDWTTVCFEGKNGKYHKIQIKTVPADGRTVSFELKEVPVGVILPDIVLNGLLNAGGEINNNDMIQSHVAISGTGDCRAYEKVNGNADSETLTIIQLQGTALNKTVNKNLMELGDIFEYHINYTNNSNEGIGKMYFYDLAPYNGDIRGSDYHGLLRLVEFDASLTDSSGKDEELTADITVYYSTTAQDVLKPQIDTFGGRDAAEVDKMLDDGKLFKELGTINKKTGGIDTKLSSDELNELISKITCLYVKVENLSGNRTISLNMSIRGAGDQQAADIYGNVAHSWIADANSEILTSPFVQSAVVSRDISGIVWYDKNNNGIRDDGEERIKDVECTLFKKDDKGNYEVCNKNILNEDIGTGGTITTDDKGAYSFEKLPEGDYIVAFKGEALKDYDGLTTYQVNKVNDAVTSDGVKSTQNGYKYAIQYSSEEKKEALKLHSLDEMKAGKATLQNYRETYSNQDMGLVKVNDLEISKTVEVNADTTGVALDELTEDKFTFHIELKHDGKPVYAEFDYEINNSGSSISPISFFKGLFGLDNDPKSVQTGKLAFNVNGNASFELKHGEKITIKNLPVGAEYTVTEVKSAGYEADKEKVNGEILSKPEENSESFTNTYKPKAAKYTPSVSKKVTGEPLPGGYTKEFTFTLQGEDEAGKAVLKDKPGEKLETTVTIPSSYTAEFEALEFKKAGTYTFTIKENDPSAEAWERKTKECTLTVEVSKGTGNNAGKLVAEASYSGGGNNAAFENAYKPAMTKYAPKVMKNLSTDSDNEPEKKEFTFTLAQDAGNPKGGATLSSSEAKAKAGEEAVSFGNITFTKAGTYNFTINEKNTNVPGYGYDDSQWTLTVTVVDKGESLVVDESNTYYSQNGIKEDGAEAATFTNSYKVDPTTTKLVVEKVVEGDATVSQDFAFTLEADANNPGGGATLPDPAAATVKWEKNSQGNKAEFDKITFTKAGTYHFTIREVTGDVAGYSYDNIPWTVTVEVKDKDSKLKVESVVYERQDNDKTVSSDQATFTNRFSMSAYFTPKVKKTFTTDHVRPEKGRKKFTFELTVDPTGPSVELPEQKEKLTTTVVDEGMETKESAFKEIEFTKAGTYIFQIKETESGKTENDGYTYDTTSWTLTVPVKQEQAGGKDVLSVDTANVKYEAVDAAGNPVVFQGQDSAATFRNTYTPAPTKYEPKVSKEISNDSAPVPSGQEKTFNFILTQEDTNPQGGAVLPGTGNVECKAGEKPVSFGEIQFTKAGTYRFLIVEDDASGHPGYTYDKSQWTLTVEVVDNDAKLEINEKETYYSKNGTRDDEVESATFTNKYAVTETTLVLKVEKVVEGDAKTPKDFIFDLKQDENDVEKATLPNDSTVTVSGAQVGQFGAVTFTKAGEYHFIITEQDNGHEGYEYDGRFWTATVIVKDDNSQLVVESVSYEQEDTGKTADDKATFTNKFSMSTTFAPKVKKDFTTDHVRPEAGQKTFQFNLESCEAYDENIVKMPKNTAVEIKDAGEKAFGKITFTKEGKYSFWITESEKATADQDGYTYDTTRWKVTVPVVQETKEENGVTNDVLKVDMDAVTYEAFAGDEATGEISAGEATFRNTYIPASVRFEPKVSKVISDESDLVPEGQEKEFEFSLTKKSENPEGGAKLPDGKDEVCVTNKAGAAPTGFGEIEFTKAGTYNFIIKEVDTQQSGYEYDKTEWTLTVTVEDKGGKLEVDKKNTYYSKNGTRDDKVEFATFTNKYEVKPATTELKVGKVVEGDAKTPKEFIFNLKQDKDDKEKATLPTDPTATVSGAQEGQFGAVTFTKAGEYHFIITEQDNGHDGYEYDGRFWTATVIVKDDNSQLVVESVSYEQEDTGKIADDKATFTNKFSMSTTFAPKVKKDFTTDHVRPEAGQKTFQFNLESCEAYDENIVKMPKNTAVEIKDAGEKAFGDITFTKEGKYSFWITESEKATADQDGYTYDTTRWKVTVPVTQGTEEENGVTNDVLKVDMDAVKYEAFAGNEATGETSAGEATFRNTYIPASVRFEPKVSKVISDESDLVPEGQEKEFEFSLTQDSGNPEGGAQLPDGKDEVRVTNKAGAAPASFGEIEFTKAGTYNFIIKEVDTQLPGYEYDKAEWTLTVTVEDKGGKLEVVDSYYSKNGKREEKATFINTYKVTETDYQPKVTKLIGGDNKDTATTAEFKFDLAFNGDLENLEFANDVVNQKDGAVLPDPATAAVTVDGANQSATGQFGNITFKKAGSYSFVVTEQTHEYPHYTYDNARWIVNVEVVDNASQLEVTKITYIKDGDIKEVIDVIEGTDKETSVIEFTNDYKPDAVTYIPQVEKTIAGGDGINETAFHFTLAEKEAGQAGVTMPDETGLKAEVTGEGTAAFGAITFDISGTYQFVVKEEAGTHPLYKYDDSEWILTVVVEDMDGELKVASAEYVSGEEGANEKAATFKNTYTGGALTVSKKVTGNLGEKDRNFTFTVKLEVPEGAKLAESYQCIGDAIKGVKAPTSGVLKPNDKGELVFTLRHGQSITITGLAADTKYTVTESDNSGYEVKKTGDTGKIKSNETKLAEFVNYRGKPVSGIATGDSANMFRWFLIMLAALATICVSVILRRRRS